MSSPLATMRLLFATTAVLGTAALLFFLTFRERPYPLAAEGIPLRDDLLDLEVRDESLWAVGHHGRVLHSADAGQSWSFQASGVRTPLSGIAFWNTATGLAVGYEGVILRTEDGGKRWERVDSPVDLYLTSVRTLADDRSFAAGEWGTIVKSDDRGRTWSIVTSEEHDFIVNDFEIDPAGRGWAVGELGAALETVDGGASWSRRTLAEDQTTLFSVDIVGRDEIWASGMDSTLFRSVDGGETWSRTEAPCDRTQLLRVRFSGPRGYAVGRRCVLVTDDSGETWRRSSLLSSLRHSWLYGLHVSSTRVWAAGYGEGIFRAGSDDDSWERIVVDRAPGGPVGRIVRRESPAVDS